jgi:type II secretory pathway component PulF
MGDRRTARLVGTLGLLLENGVALPTALKILRDVVTEPDYVAAVDRVHECSKWPAFRRRLGRNGFASAACGENAKGWR